MYFIDLLKTLDEDIITSLIIKNHNGIEVIINEKYDIEEQLYNIYFCHVETIIINSTSTIVYLKSLIPDMVIKNSFKAWINAQKIYYKEFRYILSMKIKIISSEKFFNNKSYIKKIRRQSDTFIIEASD